MSTEHTSRLRSRREELGLSRDELALKADVSGEYIRRLEMGLHEPTLPMARAIASALDSTVDSLWPAADLPAAANS